VNLADVIGHWIGRVEIVLAGAEDDLREGQDALGAGDALRARAAARRVLDRAPDSPIGLALLADACDLGHLDAELALTLEELARRAPSRAEVWVRLGHARQATGCPEDEVRSAFLRGLAVATAGSEPRVQALIALADLDIAARDGTRADLWLTRIVGAQPEVVVRRAEARMLRGDAPGAVALLAPVDWSAGDGRAALVLGLAREALGEPAAISSLLRAFVLDVPGASEALSRAIARLPTDGPTRTRIRSVVDAKGEQSLARWRASFAKAEGARGAAREALRAALRTGEPGAARALLEVSLEDRDIDGLRAALAEAPPDDLALSSDGSALASALSLPPGRTAEVLDVLTTVTHPLAIPWVTDILRDSVRRWVPPEAPSDWARCLARLGHHAGGLPGTRTTTAIAELSADLSTPVLVAVIGEFNAGKSTFINALVGAPVAPTGILPTTAVLHHLRWAPDSLAVAKILLVPPNRPSERIVAPADLRATLERIDPRTVDHVEIRLPVPSLASVEIVDTPGFNADIAEHAAVAWSALDRADIAIWLVDATQAIKQSERRVLAEAVRRKLPVQVLVNKADRLTAEQLEHVLANVQEGLESMALTSWRPPVALSSKRAFLGRTGDDDALRTSGWDRVWATVEEGIVGQRGQLKELSLRRRAAKIVSDLLDGYGARVADDEANARARAETSAEAVRAATRIEQRSSDHVTRLEMALEEPVRRWAGDLAMVFVGRAARDHEVVATDPLLERYRVDSAMTALAPIVERCLLEIVPDELRRGIEAGAIGVAVSAIVRTASDAVGVEPGRMPRLAGTIARAAVDALVDRLLAYSATLGGPSLHSRAGTVRELEAFAVALESE
jgi:cellulose synthase operon protein C